MDVLSSYPNKQAVSSRCFLPSSLLKLTDFQVSSPARRLHFKVPQPPSADSGFLRVSSVTVVSDGCFSYRPPLQLFQVAPTTAETCLSRRKAALVSRSRALPHLASQPNSELLQFYDGSSDVELRLSLRGMNVQSCKDIHVYTDESSLVVRIKQPGSVTTLMETKQLYDMIKPGETIWYLDEDQLVINLRKHDQELKWPDIVESWESLSIGVFQLLKGTSIFLVGDSSEINQKVSQELAVGLGYTPLDTKGLLETFAKQSIDSWETVEGSDAVAGAEEAVLESLSSHVRAVVATLGGKHGAAGRPDKWRHLYAGFTVWLSKTEATDEDSAKEEVREQLFNGCTAYSKADVVVKFDNWDPCHTRSVAQACLSALKQLVLSDKKLPGKKSLYIRLGCRGDWPNIEPPGWDPSLGADTPDAL